VISVCFSAMPHRKRLRLDAGLYRTRGQVVSVTTCTARRMPVFEDVEFGRACVLLLRELATPAGIEVFAYCLTPDHVHLLLSPDGRTSIVDFMRAWKSSCYHLRRKAGDRRRLWQRSFHDHLLRRDEDIRTVCDYIVGNPVRAGLVEMAREYPLSGSFQFELW